MYILNNELKLVMKLAMTSVKRNNSTDYTRPNSQLDPLLPILLFSIDISLRQGRHCYRSKHCRPGRLVFSSNDTLGQ